MQHNTGAHQVQPQFTFEGGHLVMFHQESTGLPETRDSNVNDRDRVIDLLAQEKYLSSGYNVSLWEASHDELHQVLKQNHETCVQMQRQLFNVAFKKGWYRLPVADAQSLFTAYNDLQQKKAEFPFPSDQIGQTAQTAVTGQAATQADAQLQRRVDEAMREAAKGKVPATMAQTQRRPH